MVSVAEAGSAAGYARLFCGAIRELSEPAETAACVWLWLGLIAKVLLALC
jgi:hypothetical protein